MLGCIVSCQPQKFFTSNTPYILCCGCCLGIWFIQLESVFRQILPRLDRLRHLHCCHWFCVASIGYGFFLRGYIQSCTATRVATKETRLAGMIAIVIVLFFICWLPFFLINILYTYCSPHVCDHALLEKMIPFVKFLHYSNSMMNPIVYAYRNSNYRRVFKDRFNSLLRRPNTRQKSASVMGRSEIEETNFKTGVV